MSDIVEGVDFVRPIESVIPGVQGHILAVLAETTAELNLRTIARLADVSVAQASRVLPELLELGIVQRREAPPSALFALVREHVASQALLDIADAGSQLIAEMARAARAMVVHPVSIVVFGSFARREADRASDIDVVMVRPGGIDDDDDAWSASVEQWRRAVARASGNRVEVLDVGAEEVDHRLRGRQPLWRDIRHEGTVVYGRRLAEIAEAVVG